MIVRSTHTRSSSLKYQTNQ